MRIDKVRYREIPVRKVQLHINKLVQQGAKQDDIEKHLQNINALSIQITEGQEKINYVPKIMVRPSNLRKGLIAFYVCLSCKRVVKNLYFFGMRVECRICLGLTYRKMNRRACLVKRLIFDNELRERYEYSGSLSKMRMAMEAYFAREAIVGRGAEIGVNLSKESKRRGFEIADKLLYSHTKN